MLSRLRLKNIALIERLEIEFGSGLNLLTGETGSGKSIIVDSLNALTGERVFSDLIKQGETGGQIEGQFIVPSNIELLRVFEEAGLDLDKDNEAEIIVRRDIAATGRNRTFVNDQMVTASFLKKIGAYLVDIHGQGEQAAVYDVSTHRIFIDEYAGNSELLAEVSTAFYTVEAIRDELSTLEHDENEKLQLIDILRFQSDEIGQASLVAGEDISLEEEKLRANNIEKLSALSAEAFSLLYDDGGSTLATLDRATRKIAELADFDSSFGEFSTELASSRAVIEDAALAARNFRDALEFSPARLEEIEGRLAEISRLKRKYGSTVEEVLAHRQHCDERLESIETSEVRAKELKTDLEGAVSTYLQCAARLHDARIAAARRFEKDVLRSLADVALETASFEVRIDAPDISERGMASPRFAVHGIDRVEFYFSANPGEVARPISKVASGGEASRLMLVLKTVVKASFTEKAAVFDEVDVGIGGRIAESVGRKLKDLSVRQQVMCVTHQPQIASLADRHFLVEKTVSDGRTKVAVRELDRAARVEEIARMLAGETVTDAARKNARAMLAAAK